ncbi:anthranilate synthase component I family protein [Aureispira sp. CCB-E]|uniref:anthranilate synthase component I family protein n=1 Tax=Aureispira sp. CCB-E TaxID=3051121 RepID=UPI00286965E1|nr:anthranilate synthase component I family protein [Aureispira sp. CCB-E]WMX15687.1 anthranilate synthase component I family protein [Aureispira sp. CCB-E]
MTMVLTVKETIVVKRQILKWAEKQSEVICYLDSNYYQADQYSAYEALIAVGAEKELCLKRSGNAFQCLQAFAKENQEWLFGHLSYDLKNDVEALTSQNKDVLEFPELYFFVPSYLFLFNQDGTLEILSKQESPKKIWKAIKDFSSTDDNAENSMISIQQMFSKDAYMDTIHQIRQHIIDGDTYEMNFCQEFFAENVSINPVRLFDTMNQIAKAPFATYYQIKDQHLLCGSPERFLCKRGNQLISQPIKGTIKRGQSQEEDEVLKHQLRASIKDQAENVMIVDLVRNDLTKVCQTGTIQVAELFGIYGFERVYQMISTVVGELQEHKNWVDALEATFPMGSMTGAPKVISMELIEEYEKTKRGIYSGTVGYVTPNGDFDFNVVIRSLLYNRSKQYLSFQVGGAIVYDSEPEAEYEECLLKAKTMLEALGISTLDRTTSSVH